MQAKRQEEQAAANKLQQLYRGRAARLETQHKRNALRMFQMRKEKAAACLQRAIRRRREQRLLQRKSDREATTDAAARRIQRRFRLRKQMLSYQLMQLHRSHLAMTSAALRVQGAWRRKQGRLGAHMLRVLKDEAYHKRVLAAVKLQTRWRGRNARCVALQAKDNSIMVGVSSSTYTTPV